MSGSALTPREAAVMELWDAGWRVREIARELGRDAGGVRAIVSTFSPSLAEQRWKADVRRSTDLLAAACTLSGGRFA